MKLLLDENLPHALRYEFPSHDVYTVAYMRLIQPSDDGCQCHSHVLVSLMECTVADRCRQVDALIE
jgi:hypothetical protein